jgi:hypothetical protein
MILLDDARAAQLLQLAHDRFDPDLSNAERKVLRESASSLDPEKPDPGALRPTIRPEFVRWLATDRDAAIHIDPKGVRVYGVTLLDRLELGNCHAGLAFHFFRCSMGDGVNLQFAEIRGLSIVDCTVGGSILADGIDIRGALFLRNSIVLGEVRVVGSKISADISCTGAKLRVAGGRALSLDCAEVGGSVFLSEGFESSGVVCLVNARIKGQVDFKGAKLIPLPVSTAGDDSPDLATLDSCDALTADCAEIGGSVLMTHGFESSGAIHLDNTTIGGQLSFFDAEVDRVNCTNLKLAGDMIWMGIRVSESTALDLTGARLKNLRDDWESWPPQGNLLLPGFVYEELYLHERSSEEQIEDGILGIPLQQDAVERVEWLTLQSPDRRIEPQPWIELSKHLESKGNHKGAKHVLYEFRCLQAQRKSLIQRFCAIAFAWLEEAPMRILYSISVTLLCGWLLFGHADANGALAPTDANMYEAFISGKPLAAAYPTLNPFIYTLENALPLVKLGQDEKWAPDCRHTATSLLTSYWFLMWSRWILILSGWFQATVLAAALSGRFKQ